MQGEGAYSEERVFYETDHSIGKKVEKKIQRIRRIFYGIAWEQNGLQISNLEGKSQSVLYIADFVCFERRIIIECDGGQHMEQKDKDSESDQWFHKQGYRVLRFWDNQVFQSLEIVLEEIYKTGMASPPPHPLPQGEGE